MKTYILYTTSKSKKVQEQADIFASEISKTKGRGEVKIKVVHKRPNWCDRALDVDGHVKPTWEWFDNMFPKADYDGVIFHFNTRQRKDWQITPTINGSRNPYNLDIPQFWLCDDLKTTPAEGYEKERIYDTDIIITNFLRLLFHEHAHFDEDLDNTVGNILTQDSVHDTDYKLHRIHLYHYMVDYRGKDLKEKVTKVVNTVFKLAKKYII